MFFCFVSFVAVVFFNDNLLDFELISFLKKSTLETFKNGNIKELQGLP